MAITDLQHMRIIAVIGIILSIFLIFELLHIQNKLEEQQVINNQNTKAFNSKLEVFKKDSTEAYRRLAFIEDVGNKLSVENAGLAALLKQNKETALTQNVALVQLKALTDSLKGIVLGKAIPESFSKTKLYFDNYKTAKFYKYSDSVTLSNPPVSKFKIEFTPIKLSTILARNKEGVWSGYVNVVPKWVSDYVTITSEEVSVSKDEYLRVEDDIKKFKLDLMLGGGVHINPNMWLDIGVGVVINNTHVISVNKGITDSFYYFDYKYKFSLIK